MPHDIHVNERAERFHDTHRIEIERSYEVVGDVAYIAESVFLRLIFQVGDERAHIIAGTVGVGKVQRLHDAVESRIFEIIPSYWIRQLGRICFTEGKARAKWFWDLYSDKLPKSGTNTSTELGTKPVGEACFGFTADGSYPNPLLGFLVPASRQATDFAILFQLFKSF